MTKKQLDILQAARAWREQDRAFEMLCKQQLPEGLNLTERQDASREQHRQIDVVAKQRSEAMGALAKAVDASDNVDTPESSR